MLHRARAEGIAETAAAVPETSGEAETEAETDAAPSSAVTVNPLSSIYSESIGLPQLQWAVRIGDAMDPEMLADVGYSSFVFERDVTPEEVSAAFTSLGELESLAMTGTLNGFLDRIVDNPGYRYLLDAALSNPNPQDRREIGLWLLEKEMDLTRNLSFMSPLNVLFENRTLDADDAPLVQRLLEAGADYGVGILGTTVGGHALIQLCNRDLDEQVIEPLVAEIIQSMARYRRGDPAASAAEGLRSDVIARFLPDGRSMLQYIEDGAFPHTRSRSELLKQLQQLASLQV